MTDDNGSRKPHNYFNEQSPEQQEEHRRLDAMIAEAERYKKVGEAVNMFESFQRRLETLRLIPNTNTIPSWLGSRPKTVETVRPIPKTNPMPSMPRRRRIEEQKPLLEEVMLTRGMLHAVKKKRRR